MATTSEKTSGISTAQSMTALYSRRASYNTRSIQWFSFPGLTFSPWFSELPFGLLKCFQFYHHLISTLASQLPKVYRIADINILTT